jgi:hypothetical protein
LPTSGTHPRGTWPYSDIHVDAGLPIDLSDPELSNATLQVAAASGKDAALFAIQRNDPWGYPPSGNKGLYGVNAQYHVMFSNSQPQRSFLWRAYLVPANTGGKYWGALDPKVVLPIGVPSDDGDYDGARILLAEAVTSSLLPTLLVKMATGGAATTPVNLYCDWVEVE